MIFFLEKKKVIKKWEGFNPIKQLIITATGCHDGSGGSSCCKTSNQCAEGEGDCDNNDECQANLKCGKDNCNAALGFPSKYDCCFDPNKGNFPIVTLNKKGGVPDTID